SGPRRPGYDALDAGAGDDNDSPMRTRAAVPATIALAVLSTLAAPARAVTTRVYPQDINWTGLVDEIGDQLLDEIATGSLSFVLFGADSRGYARFDLSTIPAGATVTAVR